MVALRAVLTRDGEVIQEHATRRCPHAVKEEAGVFAVEDFVGVNHLEVSFVVRPSAASTTNIGAPHPTVNLFC